MDASTRNIVVLHRPAQKIADLKRAIEESKYTGLTAKYFAEIASKINHESVLCVIAFIDEEDQSGVDFLRSFLEYDQHIQRILFVRNQPNIFPYILHAVNRAHVDYMVPLPVNAPDFPVLCRKIVRRYDKMTRALRKFTELASVTEELLAQNEKYKEDATSDPLTALLNRRSFDSMINRFWDRWLEKSVPFAMAILDLDHFKSVNDTYGHTAGDTVLSSVAAVLKNNQRTGIDFAFRYGGEEFVLISSTVGLQDMQKYVSRLLSIVRNLKIEAGDDVIQVTFSCGICHSEQASSVKDIIEKADRALYRAKDEGRNRICLAEV